MVGLFSCMRVEKYVSCRYILETMMTAELSLPAGEVYDMQAANGDDEYLSRALLRALLPDNSMIDITEDWLDCAIFLPSSEHPCEFFAVLCQNRDAAKDTASILGTRLASIRLAKEDEGGMLEGAKVVIYGNYVLLIVSSDSENALRSAKSVIRNRTQS